MPAKKRSAVKSSEVTSAPETKRTKRTSLAPVEVVKAKIVRPHSPNVYRLPPLLPPLEERKVGKVLTLGQNDVGQLGLGQDIEERKKPSLVAGLDDVVAVACGGMHTVCLHQSGEVSTFGCNDAGALGRDTSEEGSEFEPGKVQLPGKALQVTAGDSHTAALLEDGKVFAWGSFRDHSGDMGLTMKGAEKSPVEMLAGKEVVKICSGDDHLGMLAVNGVIYTCGNGEQGQLGRVAERSGSRKSRLGAEHLLMPQPVNVHGRRPSSKVRCSDIWSGSYCTFAKDANAGTIYVFGLNNYRQIGLEKVETPQFHPVLAEVFSEKKWVQISGGQHHTIALDEDGCVYSLGRHDYGRLGLGPDCDVTSTPTPLPALQDKKCTQVASGSCVSFALTEDGKVYAWGMGTNFQLGGLDEEDINEPLQMTGKFLEGRTAICVSAGGQHTAIVATKKDDEK